MESQVMKPVVMELQDETLVITQNDDEEDVNAHGSDSDEMIDSTEKEMDTYTSDHYPRETHCRVDSHFPSNTPVEVNQILACGLCDHVCDNSVQLMTHMKSHETDRVAVEQKPCVCRFCHEFLSLEYVAHHFYEHSLSMPNTTCMVCGLVFISVESLRVHLLFHKGRKPENLAHNKNISTNLVSGILYTSTLKCGYCSKKFSTTFDLKSHINECIDCNIPNKSRTQLNLLARSKVYKGGSHEVLFFHLKAKEICQKVTKKKTTSQNEKCGICGTAYQHRTNVTNHMRCVHGLESYLLKRTLEEPPEAGSTITFLTTPRRIASNTSKYAVSLNERMPPKEHDNQKKILKQTMTTSRSSTISSNTDKICVPLSWTSQKNEAGPVSCVNLTSQKLNVTSTQTLTSQREMITVSKRLTSQSDKMSENTIMTIQQGKIYFPSTFANQKKKSSVPQTQSLTIQVDETMSSNSPIGEISKPQNHNSESNFFKCEVCYEVFYGKRSIIHHKQKFHGIGIGFNNRESHFRDTSLLDESGSSGQEGTGQCQVQQQDQQKSHRHIFNSDYKTENTDRTSIVKSSRYRLGGNQCMVMQVDSVRNEEADDVGQLDKKPPFICDQEEEVLIGNSRDTSLLQIVKSRQEGTDQCQVQQKDQQNNSAMIMRLDPENFGRFLKDHNLMSHAGDFCSCGKSDNQIPNPLQQNTSMEDSGHIGRNAETNANLCDTCGGFIVQRRQTTEILKKDINQTSKISTYPWKECYCVICGKFFAHRKSLRRHIRKIHHIYGQELDQATQHVGQNTPKPGFCDICGKYFVRRDNVKKHKQKIHHIYGQDFTLKPGFCDICGKYFVCRDDVSKHKRKVHHIYEQDFSQVAKFVRYETEQASLCSDESVTESFEPEDKSSEDQLTMVTDKCVCYICKKQFVGKGMIKQQDSEHGSDADLEDEPALKQIKLEIIEDGCDGENNNRQQTSTCYQSCEPVESKLVCDICEKAFSCAKTVEGHRKQLSEKEFNEQVKCAKQMYPQKMFHIFLADECEKKSTDNKLVNNLVCDICKRVFSRPQNVKRHMKRFHRREMHENQRHASQSDVNKDERMHIHCKPKNMEKVEGSENLNSDHLNRSTKLGNKCMCHICRRVFPNKALARRHKQKVHTRELLKQARHAGHLNPAARPSNGRSHMRTIHAKENEVVNVNHRFESVQKIQSTKVNKCVCNICRRVFPNKALARRHKQKVHTRELQQARHMKQVSSNKQSFDGEDVKECIETEKKEDTESSVQIQQSTELNLAATPSNKLRCEKVFSKPSSCRSHMMTVHAEDRQVADTNQQSMTGHINKDETKQIHVETDEKGEDDNINSDHLNLSAKSSNTLMCEICKKVFSSSSNCIKHMRIVHAKERQDVNQSKNTNSDHLNVSARPSKKCQICKKVFSSSSNCRKHLRIVHAEERQDVKLNQQHVERDMKQFHRREICQKQRCAKQSDVNKGKRKHIYTETDKMREDGHINSHHLNLSAKPSNKLTCEICKKAFSDSSNCRKHMRMYHTKQSQVMTVNQSKQKWKPCFSSVQRIQSTKLGNKCMCTICRRIFPNKALARRHRQKVHRKNNIQFETVKEEASENKNVVHLPLSAGPSNTLMCEICKKVFSSSSNCRKHLRIVHAKESQDVNQLCQNKQKLKPCFVSVQRIQSTKLCNKDTLKKDEKSKNTNSDHLNVPARPSKKCQICKKVFSSSSNCRKHLRIVHAEKNQVMNVNQQNVERDMKQFHRTEICQTQRCAKQSDVNKGKRKHIYTETDKQGEDVHISSDHSSTCRKHMRIYHKRESEVMNVNQSKQNGKPCFSSVQKIQSTKLGNKCMCTICRRVFPNKALARRHKQKVHMKKNIQFETKKESENTNSDHLTVSAKPNKLMCEYCEKIFSKSSNCRKHMRIYHAKEIQIVNVNHLCLNKEKCKPTEAQEEASGEAQREESEKAGKEEVIVEEADLGNTRHNLLSHKMSESEKWSKDLKCVVKLDVSINSEEGRQSVSRDQDVEAMEESDHSQDEHQRQNTSFVLSTKTAKVEESTFNLEHFDENEQKQSECEEQIPDSDQGKETLSEDRSSLQWKEQTLHETRDETSSETADVKKSSTLNVSDVEGKKLIANSQGRKEAPSSDQIPQFNELTEDEKKSTLEHFVAEEVGINDDKQNNCNDPEVASDSAQIPTCNQICKTTDMENSFLEHSAVESSEESENDCDKAASNPMQNLECVQTGDETLDVQTATYFTHSENHHDESVLESESSENVDNKETNRITATEDSLKRWSWMHVL